MSTPDDSARCGQQRIEFMPIPGPDPEFVALMERLHSPAFLGYMPSTPQGKDDYFYRLWMEGPAKFEVITAGDDEK